MRLRLLLLVMLGFVPEACLAQVSNGDFGDPDETGWRDDLPVGWAATFPDTGGLPGTGELPGGCARILSPIPDGDDFGCLSQTFSCGSPNPADVCVITVSYRHQNLGAEPRTGGVEIRLDGLAVHVTPREENAADWRTISVTTACGSHTLALCLVRVDGVDIDTAPDRRSPAGGIEGWEAVFDNVSAACLPTSAVEPRTWGWLKSRRPIDPEGIR